MTRVFPPLEITPRLSELLAAHAPLAIGVSGGKDSDVAAFEVQAYRQAIGHKGPAILIHSDLGRVEHKASLPMCERLAARLGLDLLVVKHQKGDLMDRWLTRWQDNLQRYRELRTVKLILSFNRWFCRLLRH